MAQKGRFSVILSSEMYDEIINVLLLKVQTDLAGFLVEESVASCLEGRKAQKRRRK